ncbi:MAG: peptidoglycan DD-metalloendopeptidase family protein [Thiohalocapsa sp.]|jgi:septal ring factor EnvC (AmiA/AmiB activator)
MSARTRELGEIEERLSRLAAELGDGTQRREALFRGLERNDRDIAALARAGRQLEAMIAEQRRAVASLGERRRAVDGRLAVARDKLADLVRSAYMMGQGDRLRVLLDHQDPANSARIFGYYRVLGEIRAARLAEVRRLLEEVTDLRAQAEAEATRLRRLADRQAEGRRRLELAQAERRQIVADLDAAIASRRGEMASLQAHAESLRDLVARLQRQVRIAAEIDIRQEDFSSRKGRLRWPVRQARIIRGFGSAADAGNLHADGVLIAAPEGAEVRAAHHGRVVYADWLRGFGLLLVVDHDDGYLSLYGHNQTLLKEVGEWVGAGEVIALAGSSGGSGRPGLYFALRHQGEPLDPEDWCGRRRG